MRPPLLRSKRSARWRRPPGSRQRKRALSPGREALGHERFGDAQRTWLVVGPPRRRRHHPDRNRRDAKYPDEPATALAVRPGEPPLSPPERGGIRHVGACTGLGQRPSPAALLQQVTAPATRCTRSTAARAQIEERLVEPPCVGGRHQAVGKPLGFPGGERPAGRSAREHPHDVAVHHADRASVGEGEGRPCRVRADAGEVDQCVQVVRHSSGVALDEDGGRAVEVQRSAVVAQTCPCPHHLCRARASARSRRREPRDESSEGVDDPTSLGLLQHHLAHQDEPRVSGRPPREFPPQLAGPAEDASTEPSDLAS